MMLIDDENKENSHDQGGIVELDWEEVVVVEEEEDDNGLFLYWPGVWSWLLLDALDGEFSLYIVVLIVTNPYTL